MSFVNDNDIIFHYKDIDESFSKLNRKCHDYTNEVVVFDSEDINSPMFRNGVKYNTVLDSNMVKKLHAHIYRGIG